MRLIVPCGCCNGSGTRELTGAAAETYRALLKHTSGISGVDLARLMNVSGPAMCNRLAALERMGFVESKRREIDVRAKIYRARFQPGELIALEDRPWTRNKNGVTATGLAAR